MRRKNSEIAGKSVKYAENAKTKKCENYLIKTQNSKISQKSEIAGKMWNTQKNVKTQKCEN